MATLQQKIVDKFITKLLELENLNREQVDNLRALLANNKKPKPEEMVKIFTTISGDVR